MARIKNLRSRIGSPMPPRVSPLTINEHRRLRGAAWERLRSQVMLDAKGLCQCDECKATNRLRPAHEVDHITPLWRGGTDDHGNLQAINWDCHRRKSAREASERAGAIVDRPSAQNDPGSASGGKP